MWIRPTRQGGGGNQPHLIYMVRACCGGAAAFVIIISVTVIFYDSVHLSHCLLMARLGDDNAAFPRPRRRRRPQLISFTLVASCPMSPMFPWAHCLSTLTPTQSSSPGWTIEWRWRCVHICGWLVGMEYECHSVSLRRFVVCQFPVCCVYFCMFRCYLSFLLFLRPLSR